jgi:hypothetical protein
MRLVWLFDVDGTLIRTFGTARQSFSTGIRAVLGIQDALEDLVFAGAAWIRSSSRACSHSSAPP